MNKKDAFNTQWINIKMNEIVKLEKSEINQKQQIQNERNRYVIFNLTRFKCIQGTIISVIGYIGVLIVTLDRYWRITAPNPGYEMQLTFDIHYGLWHQCQSGTTSMQGKISF